MRQPDASASHPLPAAADCRCTCGSLLARMVPEGVELKCRRCKRTVRLLWSEMDPATQRPAAPSPESRRRAPARLRRDRWLEFCDEGS